MSQEWTTTSLYKLFPSLLFTLTLIEEPHQEQAEVDTAPNFLGTIASSFLARYQTARHLLNFQLNILEITNMTTL